jgi:patatin-like phospholipase/acyl hydrolase
MVDGGIRGMIPAMVMAEIERRTEKPISELFDLVAGSSTGGLLALAISTPGEDGQPRYTAAQLPRSLREIQ